MANSFGRGMTERWGNWSRPRAPMAVQLGAHNLFIIILAAQMKYLHTQSFCS